MTPNVAPKPKLPAFRSGLSTKGSKGLQIGPDGANPNLPRVGKPMTASKHPSFAATQSKDAKKEGVGGKVGGGAKKNPFLKAMKG